MAISVLIETYNSAKYLRKAIENVKDFDEVLIYDKGSSDDTLDIARAAGCRIIHTIEDDKGNLKCHNTAIREAKCDWILFLRPNELAPRSLKEYLDSFVDNAGDAHGLFIPNRNFLMDVENTNQYPDFRLRFFHKNGTIWNDDDDELPSVCGRIERIPASQKKYAIINIPGTVCDTVGNLEAHCPPAEGEPRKASLMEIISATAGTFLNEFVIKGKFRYGTIGYIDSVNIAIKNYFVIAKRHEECVMNKINEELMK